MDEDVIPLCPPTPTSPPKLIMSSEYVSHNQITTSQLDKRRLQTTESLSSTALSTVDVPESRGTVGPKVPLQEAWTTEELHIESHVPCSSPLLLNPTPERAARKKKIVAEW